MIRTGYWYDIEPTDKGAVQIKLIPSERWLESQDSIKSYYEVLERREYLNTQRGDIISVINGTKIECMLYIGKNYKVKDNLISLTDRLWAVRDELAEDKEFLLRSVDKKCKEIACHIQDAINLIGRLEDYEYRGLGDIEY